MPNNEVPNSPFGVLENTDDPNDQFNLRHRTKSQDFGRNDEEEEELASDDEEQT